VVFLAEVFEPIPQAVDAREFVLCPLLLGIVSDLDEGVEQRSGEVDKIVREYHRFISGVDDRAFWKSWTIFPSGS
jgi:hypothetical protein